MRTRASQQPRTIRARHAMATAGLCTCVFAAALAAPPAHADEAERIRQHVREQISVSTEPMDPPALTEVAERTVYEVSVKQAGGGTYTMYMAADADGVFRVHRYGQPAVKDGFLRLLPADFRVASEADARRLVGAAMALHSSLGKPDKAVEELRFVDAGGRYVFVDGERFGDATGFLVETDADGHVSRLEYSWKLPVKVQPGDK